MNAVKRSSIHNTVLRHVRKNFAQRWGFFAQGFSHNIQFFIVENNKVQPFDTKLSSAFGGYGLYKCAKFTRIVGGKLFDRNSPSIITGLQQLPTIADTAASLRCVELSNVSALKGKDLIIVSERIRKSGNLMSDSFYRYRALKIHVPD